MNLPTILLTIQWMMRDTIRQSIASKLFWVLFGAILLCILFCLGIGVTGGERLPVSNGEAAELLSRDEATRRGLELLTRNGIGHLAGGLSLAAIAEAYGREDARQNGVDVPNGEITVGFGIIKLREIGRDRKDSVRFVHIMLAGLIADTAGIFLALIWTAGFIPTFLEPANVTVMLAKPVPRWALLFGKFLGVMLFVSVAAIFFVLGTWLALGVKTGIFDGLYLLSVPMMILHFGIFFSFGTLMAVWSRNTTVCLLSTLIFWLASWGMNFGWVAISINELTSFSPLSRFILDASYWIFPKPLDLDMILYDALKADGFTMKVPEFERLQALHLFRPELSVLSSMLFGTVMLLCACWEFEKQEY